LPADQVCLHLPLGGFLSGQARLRLLRPCHSGCQLGLQARGRLLLLYQECLRLQCPGLSRRKLLCDLAVVLCCLLQWKEEVTVQAGVVSEMACC
jgi:hypothetical protein